MITQSISYAIVNRVQEMVLPVLLSHEEYRLDLGTLVGLKSEMHETLRIDLFSDTVLLQSVRDLGLSCAVFTEESGWVNIGQTERYQLVCDPFCNTTLSRRGFRESAVAVAVFDQDDHFLDCSIGDLNTTRVFAANRTGCYVVYPLSSSGRATVRRIHVSSAVDLEEAFVVISAMKRQRRLGLANSSLFCGAGIVYVVDGAICIGRLARGEIDAYADPYLGQPLYEMPCLEMVKQAGGLVTDLSGETFRARRILQGLRDGSSERFRFVASATPALHQQLLASI